MGSDAIRALTWATYDSVWIVSSKLDASYKPYGALPLSILDHAIVNIRSKRDETAEPSFTSDRDRRGERIKGEDARPSVE